jgi:hypothetical protein
MWLGQALGDFEKMAIHNDVERENEELRRRGRADGPSGAPVESSGFPGS